MAEGSGTKEDPWQLTTAPGSSSYTMYRDDEADPPALVCVVGSTTLRYHSRAIEDLYAWLIEQGDWVPLGAADEKKPAADGTVEEPQGGPDGLAVPKASALDQVALRAGNTQCAGGQHAIEQVVADEE